MFRFSPANGCVRSISVALLCLLVFVPAALASETSPYLVADFYDEVNGLQALPNFPRVEQSVGFAGVFYFAASDGVHGRELWRTDGTATGTYMVRDLCPGHCGSKPEYLTVVLNELFFSAWDGESGIELWKTDGTLIEEVAAAGNPPSASDPFGTSDGWVDLWISDDGRYLYQLAGLNGSIVVFAVDGASLTKIQEVEGDLPLVNTQGIVAF